ncbi:MAG: DUF58 domain-containing protein [Gaiellaceae bacterium]
MTGRGRLALAFGLTTYLAAWAFGSRPLYPVALGLLLAVGVASLWVRLSARPAALTRTPRRERYLEGEDVLLDLRVELDRGAPPPGLVLAEQIAGLGERRVRLERHGRHASAHLVLHSLPRGRYAFSAAEAVVEDPFGLERRVVPLGTAAAILVYPRTVELPSIFSENGPLARDGRRQLQRRPSGFDLHSVREHVEGEPLRNVHWRTTARRGRLMVKEVEDAPRDEVAVVLDTGADVELLDLAVRAAGSLLLAHTGRGRKAALVAGDDLERDPGRALERLAAVVSSPALPRLPEAHDLVLVGSRLPHGLVDRLVARTLGRRRIAVVWVAADGVREPALLRLQSVGVPVALLHPGDDLATVLSGSAEVRSA